MKSEMNGFYKMQERLREEGWFVGWNLPCCQSCAWGSLPMYLDAEYDEEGYLIREDADGNKIEYEDVDFTKVLFNHSQDCEVWIDGEECPKCDGDGYLEDDECEYCGGVGEIDEGLDASRYDTSVSGFICNYPDQQNSSYFCFDGSKEGVANFKAIIPIIEECGVKVVHFSESGETRIELSW